MTDLLVGIGLVLVIEGLLWAAFPWLALKMLMAAAEMPEQALRTAGTIAMVAGVVIIWAVRG
jgi:uncharacterized protein